MSKGHWSGTNAPSSMRTGPGPMAGAGIVRMAAQGKGLGSRNAHAGGKDASGTNMSVGSKAIPKGMKIQRSGE